MKKPLKGAKHKLSDYWRKLMRDTQSVRMSRGAFKVDRIIAWARKDNWRRKKK